MAKTRDESIGFPELVMQARITNRLLAAQLKVTMGQQDLVRLLSSTGASNQEIADVLDTTAATVSNTLQRLKKKAQGRETVASSDPTPRSAGAQEQKEA